MAEIEVEKLEGDAYRVRVSEGSSRTTHTVSVSDQALARYAPGAAVETLLEESFRFLLEREPKESILARFEISVIERYFPEYPREIRRRAKH